MQQFKIKLPRPVKHIEPQIFSGMSKERKKENNAARKDERNPLVEAQKIKILKERIKILELELQKAREESFKAGYEEGKENTLREANKRIEMARNEMTRMAREYNEALERIEKPLLELAKKMAVQVIETELSLKKNHDEMLLKRLRSLLQEVQNEKQVNVEVHPDHLPFLKSTDIKEALRLPREMELTVLQGKHLKKGEAFVKTENFYVDGRFESQIDAIGDQLMHGEDV